MIGRTARAVLVIALAMVAAAPVAARDSAAKQAEREMEIGYDAARNGYWQAALMRFRRADDLQPGQARILNNIAVALEATAQYEDALVTYERAAAADPSDRVVRRNMERFREFYRQHVAEPEKEGDGDPDADDDLDA